MTKVLVVEDTMENMEAAKSFFATVEGFEFIFATNREQAEVLLKEADALITDRSIPFSEEKHTDADTDVDENVIAVAEANGYLLFVLALISKKAVIMASEHSCLRITEPKNTNVAIWEQLNKFIHRGKFAKNLSTDYYKLFGDIFQVEFIPEEFEKTPKNSPKTWEFVWEKLKKQL